MHACASVTKQYNLVPADGSSAGKVTAGLAKSNGNLPPAGWLQITCGLTAYTPRSAPGPTLGNEYGRTLPLLLHIPDHLFDGSDVDHLVAKPASKFPPNGVRTLAQK